MAHGAPPGHGLLAHQTTGAGEPVLLLNGGLMSMAAWEPVSTTLAAERRVVLCDLRGQLLSPGTPPATLDGHVDDALRLLDALALESADVVGASFGALVALRLAARHPGRARSLVAVTACERITNAEWPAAQRLIEAALAASAGADGRRVFDLLAETTFSPAYVSAQGPAFAERRERIGRMPRAWFEALAGLLESLRGLDLRPLLGAIRCPTLVVGAELDLTFPPERSRALAAAVPGARLEIVPGAGHALVVEAPEALLRVVREFWSHSSEGAQS
ncbi:MAG: alpha/beta fold hydrolase [Vicinamibacteria bacterium]